MAQEQQDGQDQSLWRPTRRQVLWASGILIFVFCSYVGGWKWTGIPKRTLWYWLELLIVPGALAFGVYWLNQRQAARAAAEREATEEARRLRESQDEALQEYLEQMRQLLTDKEQPLQEAQPGDNPSTVARASTLRVLGKLDGGQKRSVLQFLYEADLIKKGRLVVNLEQADLHGAELDSISMPNINLYRVDLRWANGNYSNLHSANLRLAALGKANLKATDLGGADLRQAYLQGASLSSLTILRSADLSDANLRDADLRSADLSDANLRNANLEGVRAWTGEQLERAASLEGAAIPDGQRLKSDTNPDGPTLEEWLKSKGRGEDGKNSPS